GGGRDVRQRRGAVGAATGPGARGGADDAGGDGPAGGGIRRQPRQEIGGGYGPRREDAGATDGEDAPAGGGFSRSGRGRRARHRHLPRPPSRHGGTEGQRVIGKLKGLIDGYGDDHVHLDVGGVVYEAFCSSKTL